MRRCPLSPSRLVLFNGPQECVGGGVRKEVFRLVSMDGRRANLHLSAGSAILMSANGGLIDLNARNVSNTGPRRQSACIYS